MFSDATTTLWRWAGSIINLLSYIWRAFWQNLRTVQEWGVHKKGSLCWDGCLKISSPKTRKCHCAAQMDNSAHKTPKYPSSLVLKTCSEVQKFLYTKNSICNMPESWGWKGGYQYALCSVHGEEDQNPLCQTSKRVYVYPSGWGGCTDGPYGPETLTIQSIKSQLIASQQNKVSVFQLWKGDILLWHYTNLVISINKFICGTLTFSKSKSKSTIAKVWTVKYLISVL